MNAECLLSNKSFDSQSRDDILNPKCLSLADLIGENPLSLSLKYSGIPLMNKWIQAAFMTLLAAGSGFAGTVSFSGTLSQDDNAVLYDFTANSSELITIQSHSYLVGGFAPTAFIFDGLGDVFPLTNGTCAQVGQDPTTLNCDDLYFQDTLGPGSFVLALAVYDNRPGYNRGGFGGAGVGAGTGQFPFAAERRLVDRVAAGGFRLQG